jgi:lipid II:glycine glycyltransferase (peptidoglycan interpeptide bridge formation enzyme)
LIKFLAHTEIDKTKWDNCINHAQNSLIYAYSWYLDIVAPGWNALVMDNYEAVMALPTAKKIFTVAYQPFFTQQLGVFYIDSTLSASVNDFLDALPSDYKYLNICLNEANDSAVSSSYKITQRSNYILHLHKSYDELVRSFNDQTRRNINKGHKSNLEIVAANTTEVVEFYIKNKGDTTENVRAKDYDTLKKLLNKANELGFLKCYQVINEQKKAVSYAAFYVHHNRIIYQMGASNSEGRSVQAISFLFDRIIFEHSNKSMLLDFEGSEIPSVARFFNGFGSLCLKYNRVIANLLPWPLNLLKK